MVAIPYSRWHIPMYAEIFMKVPEDMRMSMAGGVNGQRQSRSQSRLVNLIDALVGIDSTKEDPFMLLTIRQGFFCANRLILPWSNAFCPTYVAG